MITQHILTEQEVNDIRWLIGKYRNMFFREDEEITEKIMRFLE